MWLTFKPDPGEKSLVYGAKNWKGFRSSMPDIVNTWEVSTCISYNRQAPKVDYDLSKFKWLVCNRQAPKVDYDMTPYVWPVCHWATGELDRPKLKSTDKVVFSISQSIWISANETLWSFENNHKKSAQKKVEILPEIRIKTTNWDTSWNSSVSSDQKLDIAINRLEILIQARKSRAKKMSSLCSSNKWSIATLWRQEKEQRLICKNNSTSFSGDIHLWDSKNSDSMTMKVCEELNLSDEFIKNRKWTEALVKVNNFLCFNPNDKRAVWLWRIAISMLGMNESQILIKKLINNSFEEVPVERIYCKVFWVPLNLQKKVA